MCILKLTFNEESRDETKDGTPHWLLKVISKDFRPLKYASLLSTLAKFWPNAQYPVLYIVSAEKSIAKTISEHQSHYKGNKVDLTRLSSI